MLHECEVKVRFFLPPADLRRYFTTFYLVELSMPSGHMASDYLHPEWANLRFYSGEYPVAETADGMHLSGASFAATGPSAKTVKFGMGTSRMWGIGLLPLGWAQFGNGPASDIANAVVDGDNHPAFASFTSLARTIFGEEPDCKAEYGRIVAHFESRIAEPVADEDRIVAIHAALIDPETDSVARIVEATGTSQRTVERLCSKAFGFSPKLLLRRQRFMRSLVHFMLDPSLKWIGAIDGNYHDQAQFVRDFRQFMGMTPREYAALPKPIVGAIVHERARFAGSAVQALDTPDGPSPQA